MNYPWMKLHTRDWLDNKELRRCSPLSRSVLADLMCLAHEGVPYGHLTDKVGALTEKYMASRCVVPIGRFRAAVKELKSHGRVDVSATGSLFIERMVADEDLRNRRATGGNASVGHPHTPPKKQKEGYPPSEADSRERTRAGSGSESTSDFEVKKETSLQQIREPPKPKYSLDVYLDLFRMAGKALNAKDEMRTGTIWNTFEPAEQERIIEWTAEQMRSVWSSEKYTPMPHNALESGGWTRKGTPRIISDPRPAAMSKNDRAIEILKQNLTLENKPL